MFGSKRNSNPDSLSGAASATSFLPEDYLQRKWESRANAVSLLLFGVVLFGVIGAFFVTHQAWNAVRVRQREINAQYTEQTKKIEQLKILEQQKAEMLEKADVTSALIERVPRSILLAELVNRMPERMTLTEIEVKSKRIAEAASAPKPGPQSIAKGPVKGAPLDPKLEAPKTPKPPKMEFQLSITGLAATDEAVADFLSSLKKCALLDRVDHVLSQTTVIESQSMRRFRVEAQVRTDADARKIEPLKMNRANSPMGALLPGADPSQPFDPNDPTGPRPAEDPNFNPINPGKPVNAPVNGQPKPRG